MPPTPFKKGMDEGFQIHQKHFKNRSLGLQGTRCGVTLEPLGKHLEHMRPKDWILKAFGTVLGAQDAQFGSNLGAQDFPKSMQECEEIGKSTAEPR